MIFEMKLIPLSLTKDNTCHCEDRNKRYRRSNIIRNTRCVLIDVTLDVYRLIKQVTKPSTLRGDIHLVCSRMNVNHSFDRGRTENDSRHDKLQEKEKERNQNEIDKITNGIKTAGREMR